MMIKCSQVYKVGVCQNVHPFILPFLSLYTYAKIFLQLYLFIFPFSFLIHCYTLFYITALYIPVCIFFFIPFISHSSRDRFPSHPFASGHLQFVGRWVRIIHTRHPQGPQLPSPTTPGQGLKYITYIWGK